MCVSGSFYSVHWKGVHTEHTLHHSYATQLLEAGLNLGIIQAYLGHASPTTTAIYTHLTKPSEDLAIQAAQKR